MARPCAHQLAAFFEQVRPPIGPLHLTPHLMPHCLFDGGVRYGSDFLCPCSERRPEAVRRNRSAVFVEPFAGARVNALQEREERHIRQRLPAAHAGENVAQSRAFSISQTISTARGESGTRNGSVRCSRSFRLANGTVQTTEPKSNWSQVAFRTASVRTFVRMRNSSALAVTMFRLRSSAMNSGNWSYGRDG